MNAQVRERMPVFAVGGCRIGTVDGVQGGEIKLSKGDPQAGGEYHFIPLDWVERVDGQVFLNKDAQAVKREWKEEFPRGK